MIKNSLKNTALAAMMLLILSCSSMKSDAKKAAKLTNKSIEQTHALKLEEAEKSYLKAQEIITKYKKKDKTEEFYELFATYRDKEKKQNAK